MITVNIWYAVLAVNVMLLVLVAFWPMEEGYLVSLGDFIIRLAIIVVSVAFWAGVCVAKIF